MNFDIEIAEQAGERWLENQKKREKNEKHIVDNQIAKIESDERIQMRLERLKKNIIEEQNSLAEIATAASDAIPGEIRYTTALRETVGFERILGKSDLTSVNFLEKALAVSRFVGRINVKISPTQTAGFGTGFMVSPRLLITNNHVIASEQFGKFSEVEFDYQYDRFGRLLPVNNFRLEPETFFLTNKKLDFTIIAVSESSVNGNSSIKTYGWSRLIGEEGKALLGDALNIIQHPRGEAKQIALRSNKLLDLPDEFAHYETDTEPGSSGSPVYNDQWEVVALHHSGVPEMKNGQIIAIDGSVWKNGDDPKKISWIANEGVRISRIVNFIKDKKLSSDQEKLKNDLLELTPPNPLVAAIESEKDKAEKQKPIIIENPNKSSDDDSKKSVGAGNTNGAISFTVPLHIEIKLGEIQTQKSQEGNNFFSAVTVNKSENPSTSAQLKDTSPAIDFNIDTPDFKAAMDALNEAGQKPYYDNQADQQAQKDYYDSINPDDLDRQEFYQKLSKLLINTHGNPIKYKPAVHVYPWVDLHEEDSRLVIKSIYSGNGFEPQEFIKADLIADQRREMAKEMLLNEVSFGEINSEEWLDTLEASFPYNCEHVVPQSWFNKKEPMRGDLHHLFACESRCNSFRSNIPYHDFPDFNEAIQSECGKRIENKFEPLAGKGAVARATLYFLLRYPGEINQTGKEYTADRLLTLLNWHRGNEVDRYEKHRNAAIFEMQGNRNPLIDFPEWADKIDFTQGLG